MDWLSMLKEIFEVCIIPLLGVLTTYLVKFINTKRNEILTSIQDSTARDYIEMLTNTITTCVIATNQTYVDSLKIAGNFDAAAQKEAFSKTLDAVKSILNDEVKNYLAKVYGDIDAFIQQQIEACVNENKLSIR